MLRAPRRKDQENPFLPPSAAGASISGGSGVAGTITSGSGIAGGTGPVAAGAVDWPQATLAVAGQVICGPTVSVTVIVCVHDTEFAQPSVAVHVRVIT